jgi:hypothetical protein
MARSARTIYSRTNGQAGGGARMELPAWRQNAKVFPVDGPAVRLCRLLVAFCEQHAQ